ncbi:hypothetical protein BJF93_23585 [Xaviernesmea oryzae]|uniref:PIN domain-containing protein n=1 Tax=Xaviernesmea oryzae TaxID=464029 RepID=A0A1Q9B2X6_9HYPH|nr:PIN domain-containing protein [Xaviernesmea oryzae]OLP62343.1 hypothetical protein BJF93_23585 [Xaviernesmea oryzae]SEL97491.1 Predicted nucleic-acid-binding protein, contains PIN domain [Xaviernesmea oryzae]
MIGIDTNVLLRWIAMDVLAGEEAREQVALIEQHVAHAGEDIFVNRIVVVELVLVLSQRAKLAKERVAEVVLRLLHASGVIVEERDALLTAVNSYVHSPGGFADHLIGEINRRSGCRTTLTFDRAAAKSPYFTELGR